MCCRYASFTRVRISSLDRRFFLSSLGAMFMAPSIRVLREAVLASAV